MGLYGSGYSGDSSPTSNYRGLEDRNYIYSDLDFIFDSSPLYQLQGLSGDIVRKFDVDAIKQSVKNIVMTNHYERPWKPLMGCNIRRLLFESFADPWVRWSARESIKEQLEKWEPRVTVKEVLVSEDQDYLELNIEVIFTINPVGGNLSSEDVSVKIQMERLR